VSNFISITVLLGHLNFFLALTLCWMCVACGCHWDCCRLNGWCLWNVVAKSSAEAVEPRR